MDALQRPEEKALWERANRHLVRYGHYFQPVIIEKAQGSFMTTTDGRRLLDWGHTKESGSGIRGCAGRWRW